MDRSIASVHFGYLSFVYQTIYKQDSAGSFFIIETSIN